MREPPRHIVVSCLVAVLLSVPGCKAVRKWFSPADQVELAPLDTRSALTQTTLSDPQARRGLEVRMLVVDDTGYDAPRLLRDFERGSTPNAIDPATRERWADWGFRIVEVPVDQLDTALSSLRPVRPISVQWLGEFGSWRALIRAGYSEQTRVRVGGSTRTIEPGRLRLIARSWIEPMLTDSGSQSVLRLDLGMQIENSSSTGFSLLPDQRARTLDDEGQIIDELLSTLALRGEHAIVIIGEIPGTDWAKLPQPAPVEFVATPSEEAPGPEGEDDDRGTNAKESGKDPDLQGSARPKATPSPRPFASPSPEPLGPQIPALRSLGELMLVAQGSRLMRANETRDIPRRVLIVLVPEVRGNFELLNIPPEGGES